MAAPNLHGFLAQNRVAIFFDLSSPLSKISPSVVCTPDLAAIFTEFGHLTSTITLGIPMFDGYYSSRLDLVIGYSLPPDVVLGADLTLPADLSPTRTAQPRSGHIHACWTAFHHCIIGISLQVYPLHFLPLIPLSPSC